MRWSKGRKSEFAIRILRNQHQILLLIWHKNNYFHKFSFIRLVAPFVTGNLPSIRLKSRFLCVYGERSDIS